MRKLAIIILASMAMAACGDGSNRSEANQNDDYETNEPAVSSQDNTSDDNAGNGNNSGRDTSSTNMQTDTTSTRGTTSVDTPAR